MLCDQVHAVCKEDGCSVGFCAAHNKGPPEYLFGIHLWISKRMGKCQMCDYASQVGAEAGMYIRYILLHRMNAQSPRGSINGYPVSETRREL